LSLSEDRNEQIRKYAFGGQRSNDQQRGYSEKSRRLDEHGGDCLVQPTNPTGRPRDGANVLSVQDESDDDHEGEDDVERKRDRKVWKGGPDIAEIPILSNRDVDRQNAYHYLLSTLALSITTVHEELKYVPTEARYRRQGKAITQRFLE